MIDKKITEGSSRSSSNLIIGKQSQWVIKNSEVVPTNFENLWIVTKHFAFDDWREI